MASLFLRIQLIGERLAEIRKDHGDTQQTLAARINVTKSRTLSENRNRIQAIRLTTIAAVQT